MDSLTLSMESNEIVSALVDKLDTVCANLLDVFTVTIEKVKQFASKTIKGFKSGSKTLFVDHILRYLKMIDHLLQDIKLHTSSMQYEQIVADVEQNIAEIMVKRNFIKNVF